MIHELQLVVLLSIPFVAGRGIEIRQTDGKAYCGHGPEPNPHFCREANNLINTDNGYYHAGDEFRYGDCSIFAHGQPIGGRSISGQTFADLANRIMDTCGILGWAYHGTVNVSISQCKVCAGGICTTCNSPGQGPVFVRDLGDADSDLSPSPIERSPPSNAEQVSKRDETPMPGFICGASGAAHVSSCMELADLLADMDRLCQVALEPTVGDVEEAESSHVGQMLRDVTDLCKDPQGEYVGRMQNNHGMGDEYEMFAGNLRGRFGFGIGGCVP